MYQEFETNEDFKYLANSSPGNELQEDSEHLITVSLSAVQKNSPQYNGISQQFDITFNTLLFNCNKKIVVKLLNMIQSIETTIKETISKPKPSRNQQHGGKETFKADKNNPKIVIAIKMRSLNVHLNEDDEAYFAFEVKNLQLNFDIDIESSMMRFKLGNLLVTDISRDASKDLGPLFGTDGEHIVEVYVMSYSSIEKDTTISVRMSSVKLIVIRPLVDRLAKYFEDFDLNKMSTSLSESAKGAVERMHESHKKSRVLFEIDVSSPRIILPKNLVSPYVLIADLGHISVFNSYSNSLEDPSIQLEEIYIYASSMNFQSCKFQSGKVMEDTIEKLSNLVNMYVCIETFIESCPTSDSPKQKVLGELSPVSIKITDQQYILLISIIKSLVEPTVKRRKKKIRTFQRLEKHNLDAQQGTPDIKDQISFRLPLIQLEIYRKNNRESVVSFEIDQLDFSMIEYVNDSEYTTLSMNSIELIDTRKSSNNNFKKLLYHSKEHKKKELTVYICEKKNGNTELKITLDHLRANIVPESIIAMIDFIMPGVKLLTSLSEIETPVLSPLVVPDPGSTEMVIPQLLMRKSPVKLILDEAKASNAVINNPQIMVHIEATKIELCLVENPTRVDSRALIAKGNLQGKISIMTGTLDYTDIHMCFDRLEVFKCRMDQAHQTAVSIIDPMSITLTIAKVEGEESNLPQDIIITAEPLRITFSFQDYQLCHAVYNSIMTLSQSLSTLTAQNQEPEKPPKETALTLNLSLADASVTLINDHGVGYHGVADVKIKNLLMEIKENKVFLLVFFAANYFNTSTSSWEPLCEQWGFKMCVEHVKDINTKTSVVLTSNNTLNINVSKALLDIMQSSYRTFSKIYNDLQMLTNIQEFKLPAALATATPTSSPLVTHTSRSLKASMELNGNALLTFVLKNETGLPLTWSIDATSNAASQDMGDINKATGSVETGAEITFALQEPSKKTRDATSISTYKINFKLPGFKQITHLPVDKNVFYVLDLQSETAPALVDPATRPPPVVTAPGQVDDSVGEYDQKVVYEIISSLGSRVIVLRSNYLLVNETDHDLDFVWPSRKDMLHINAHQSKALPLINQDPTRAKFEFWDSTMRHYSEQIPFTKGPSVRIIQFPPMRYYCIQVDSHMFGKYLMKESEPASAGDQTAAADKYEYNDDILKDHMIKISVPLVIENALASTMSLRLQYQRASKVLEEMVVESGHSVNVHTMNTESILMMRIKTGAYEWSNLFQINLSTKESIDRQLITLVDKQDNKLAVKLEHRTMGGSIVLSLYTDFWIVNRTGMSVCYNNISNESSQLLRCEGTPDVVDINQNPRLWYKDLHAPIPPPMMFSTGHYEAKQSITLRIDNSEWSEPIQLNSKQPSDINIEKKVSGQYVGLQFAATVSTSKEFFRTHQITLSPKYIIINNLPVRLYYGQNQSSIFNNGDGYFVEPNEKLPFHFLDRHQPQQLSVRLAPTCPWSGAFTITKSSMLHLRLSTQDSPATGDQVYLPLVQIFMEKNYFFIVFNPESRQFPPYRIENLTTLPISIMQKDSLIQHQVDSGKSIRYTWDCPMLPALLEVKIPTTKYSKTFSLSKLYESSSPVSIKLPSGDVAHIKSVIYANGTSNILQLIDVDQEVNSPNGRRWYTATPDIKPLISFEALLGCVTLSVIDADPKELLFGTFTGIHLSFDQTALAEQSLNLSVNTVKIDNQLYNTPYPVLLCALVDKNHKFVEPMVSIAFSRSNSHEYKKEEKSSIEYIKLLKFDVAPLKIKIDEALLFNIYNLVNMIEFSSPQRSQSDTGFIPTPETVDSKRLYFEHLSLPPIDISISYCSSAYSSAMMGSKYTALANIENAQLHLLAWDLDHQFVTQAALSNALINHFSWSFLRLAFYSDIFGAPVSLGYSISRGLNDFYNESCAGLNKNQIRRGLVQGTSSLLKNSFYGIFNSAGRLTGTLGSFIAPLSMDNHYIQSRNKSDRHLKPNVGSGLKELLNSFSFALAGIVKPALNGVKRMDPTELVSVTKGTLGAGVKLGVGVIDLMSHTSQGVRNMFRDVDENSYQLRSRSPRFIGADQVVDTFDPLKSFWQEQLCILNQSTPIASGEYYQTHMEYFDPTNQQPHYLLLSNKCLYLLNEPLPTLEWWISLSYLGIRLIPEEKKIVIDDLKTGQFRVIGAHNIDGQDISADIFTTINDHLDLLLAP
ncbi:hypothetical protein SAMD00019534_083530 [Acytostelium subglobosum LB1]|uniref:hypothetical protein n=1 Tax=Acytostelium subglobosum LB1 TaxID=1410327 RepID=UPI000644BD06|nr:hypothetical protein SAMD00019534_083530 [Acytostelium subglobosum LB1]GAM25178.1 hypothetical protein SAMD00019534_083530 [Acytostelium subglobosum LB1]|eukprot:XP_012751698.1 hypothetical protein SAMD00019534_083530 [Acytostelium subglobosum LB1]